MSGIVDKAEDYAGDQLDKKSQPGNGVEKGADSAANTEINNVADQAGVPKQDDKIVDEAADSKVNEEIPFGNK